MATPSPNDRAPATRGRPRTVGARPPRPRFVQIDEDLYAYVDAARDASGVGTPTMPRAVNAFLRAAVDAHRRRRRGAARAR